jgi:hypothetical protein
MLRNFLLPESIARADGSGPDIELGPKRGKLLVLTLGITRILEQESLEVTVWGSPDGEKWDSKPLVKFPPKFYCGLYSILLNLGSRSEVRFLRVHWTMSRWSKRESMPMFGFYVYAEESGARVSVAVA